MVVACRRVEDNHRRLIRVYIVGGCNVDVQVCWNMLETCDKIIKGRQFSVEILWRRCPDRHTLFGFSGSRWHVREKLIRLSKKGWFEFASSLWICIFGNGLRFGDDLRIIGNFDLWSSLVNGLKIIRACVVVGCDVDVQAFGDELGTRGNTRNKMPQSP